MNNPVIYIILNKELKMSAGKAAAQATHAAMMLQEKYDGQFTDSYKRTVIVLEGTGEQIKNLHIYLQEAGIFSDYYIDEGINEVEAYSVTALAVEPVESYDEEKRSIFSGFNLYGSHAGNAWKTLSDYVNSSYGFMGTPWHVNRTIKWLKKESE